jgi:hypothetical protein
MRFFQLPSKTRLAAGHPGECEEAIFKVTGQSGNVLQVFDRLSLSVQDPFDSLDDVRAMGEEELEKFDMCLKRRLGRARSGRPLLRRKKRMKG